MSGKTDFLWEMLKGSRGGGNNDGGNVVDGTKRHIFLAFYDYLFISYGKFRRDPGKRGGGCVWCNNDEGNR